MRIGHVPVELVLSICLVELDVQRILLCNQRNVIRHGPTRSIRKLCAAIIHVIVHMEDLVVVYQSIIAIKKHNNIFLIAMFCHCAYLIVNSALVCFVTYNLNLIALVLLGNVVSVIRGCIINDVHHPVIVILRHYGMDALLNVGRGIVHWCDNDHALLSATGNINFLCI